MIKYLANYCTQEELDQNGITVQGPLPQRIPLMNYPEFSEECTSLLKAHLTKDVWSAMKKRATHLGGKIQLCVQCGVYDQKDEIGIYATDEEAYKVFDDIFIPILQDLHPDYDMKANYKNEMELVAVHNLPKLTKLKNKISFVQVSARRNFKDFPFTPMMSTQIKFQIEKKIVETLGEVYGQYHQLGKIDDELKSWLESVGIDINRNKSHDSAGINEDWPSGRGVFIDDNRAFVILVNFEDHIQVFTISQDGDFSKNLKDLMKILSKFEKIGYARHTSLGFLTASPKNLGTTLKFTIRIKLQTKHHPDDLESFEGTYSCKINKIDEEENIYEITYLKTLAKNLTENEAISEFGECLLRLTENENDEVNNQVFEEEKAVELVSNPPPSNKPTPISTPKNESREPSKREEPVAKSVQSEHLEDKVESTPAEEQQNEPSSPEQNDVAESKEGSHQNIEKENEGVLITQNVEKDVQEAHDEEIKDF